MSSIKIYNQNCIDYIKNLDGEVIDLTVTSPPYFNAREYSQYDTYEDYLSFIENVFTLIFEKTKSGRMCSVNISCVLEPRASRNKESKRYPIPFHFVNIMEKIGWKFIEDIIWVKPDGSVKNRNGNFFQQRQPITYKPNIVNEYIFVFQKPSKYLIDRIVKEYKPKDQGRSLVKDGYERTNVWNIRPESKLSKLHTAPYPVEIPQKIIEYYSYIGDTVFDPFLGSGTTALACKYTERDFIGTEIHKEYYDVAMKRLDLNTSKLDMLFV